jgi:hypothetical protein
MWDKLRSVILVYLKDDELEKYESLMYDEVTPNIKSCKVLTKEAHDIYSTRSRSPASLSGKIRGFDKLLEELDKVNDSTVLIHRVLLSNIKLVVFTNYDITKVLGVLFFSE